MAGFFPRRSLAQDEVDRYTTWATVLFLFLALITLLMPLSPMMRSKPQVPGTTAASPQTTAAPKVKATCWAPAQFEKSQVDYTTTFCTGVANGILNGIEPNGSFVPYSDPAVQPSFSPDRNENKVNFTSFESTLKTFFEARDEHNAQQAKNERIREKTRELVDFRTPVILVLLALCLQLPYMLASLVRSAMTSGVNIDQALDTCVASRSLDIASQRQIHEETAAALADSLQASKSAVSLLFLFTKVLILLVVLAETIYIGKFILPDMQDMEVSYEENSAAGSSKSVEKMENASRKLFAYPNNVFHCTFDIRLFQIVQSYTVQCTITYLDVAKGESNEKSTRHISSPTDSSIKGTLLLYQALFSVTLAILAFLLVVSVINTVSWFLRLFVKSHATSLGLPSNVAKDPVLMVHMARLNVGPVVARGLAGSSVWSNKLEKTNDEPTMESTA